MTTLAPTSDKELASALVETAAAGQRIRLEGAATKSAYAGPLPEADVAVTTNGLARVLAYEPRDLTISVEAGVRYQELERIVAAEGQMLPLDPPFAAAATIGGIVAANTCGPRRRLYGAVRDQVIGMRLATLDGELIDSGGMVVKNVAGLDLAKLLIGSFGTLAAIASVNFKLAPRPAGHRTFVYSAATPEPVLERRRSLLAGVLQPAAVDLLNPAGAALVGLAGHCLVVRAAGSPAVLDRYGRELDGAAVYEGSVEETLWERIREFVPALLGAAPGCAVVRAAATLAAIGGITAQAPGPALARAASGVAYLGFPSAEEACRWMASPAAAGASAVLEAGPQQERQRRELWPAPGDDLPLMREMKALFDPRNLLNPGRLYGRL
jgi:glycolate oxidase FAD binding subunit